MATTQVAEKKASMIEKQASLMSERISVEKKPKRYVPSAADKSNLINPTSDGYGGPLQNAAEAAAN